MRERTKLSPDPAYGRFRMALRSASGRTFQAVCRPARIVACVLCMSLPHLVMAEPFLAIQTGFHCSQCHVNPTGGGLRNSFGRVFTQTQLPVSEDSGVGNLLGELGNQVSIGLDMRGSARLPDTNAVDDNLSFMTDRVTLYLSARLAEGTQVYLDQQMAPGGSLNREAWVRLGGNSGYLKAGRLFLPFGIRLEDDTALIRQLTNIHFNTPDTGIEIGHIGTHWNLQLAVTNGNGGGFVDSDDGKQISVRGEWVQSGWRAGGSVNLNETDSVDRDMTGIFAGIRTGAVSWLLEFDQITDSQSGLPDREQDLAFIEANWLIRKGHYLKLGLESRSGGQFEDLNRTTVEYQWFPHQHTHLRFGYRDTQSDNPVSFANQSALYSQIHVSL